MKSTETEEDINNKERDEERLTSIGRWMRNRGVDELPQIVNILIGKMSFVGPRPYLKKNLERIEELNPEIVKEVKSWERQRSQVLPGLSGWHQIHSEGPGVIKYDLEYLQNPNIHKRARVIYSSIIIMIIGKARYFKSLRSE
jgi:lipopolysaccharide/colanic/teichoic acid biosynthesis glycosyltransferase